MPKPRQMPTPSTLQVFIGIDPGVSGGLALLDEKGDVIWALNMPDTELDLFTTLDGWQDWHPRAVLERVHGGIGGRQGASGMFNYGRSYGSILMGLTAAGIPFDTVPPQTWQKVLGVVYPKGSTQTERKNISKRRAQQLFPSLTVTHAIADALLLAEHCRRIHAGEHRHRVGDSIHGEEIRSEEDQLLEERQREEREEFTAQERRQRRPFEGFVPRGRTRRS